MIRGVAIAMFLSSAACSCTGKGDAGQEDAGSESAGDDDEGTQRCPERRITGEVYRVGEDANLDDLEGATYIENLVLEELTVESLDFLHCLEEVGRIAVLESPTLISLDGLQSLRRAVEVNLHLNPKLKKIDELRSLEWVESLGISEMPVDDLSPIAHFEELYLVVFHSDLKNLSSLPNLRRGTLSLLGNDKLVSLRGLPVEGAAFDDIRVTGHFALETLEGLPRGSVRILNVDDNPVLSNVCALAGLTGVVHFNLADNPQLTSVECLGTARGWWPQPEGDDFRHILVEGNSALVSLKGLPSSAPEAEWVEIMDNDALTDLQGLEFLETVTQGLTIANHDRLTSLAHIDPARLGSLKHVNVLQIRNNVLLGDCEIDRFLEGVQASGGTIEFVDRVLNMEDECTDPTRRP